MRQPAAPSSWASCPTPPSRRRATLPLSSEQRIEYGRIVWAAFCKRRGSDWPDCSSAEWDHIRQWMDAEVPLRFVLFAIENYGGTDKRPRRLSYFVEPVKAEHGRAVRMLG